MTIFHCILFFRLIHVRQTWLGSNYQLAKLELIKLKVVNQKALIYKSGKITRAL